MNETTMMENPTIRAFSRVLYVGMVPNGKRKAPLFVKARLSEDGRLSMTGVIGPLSSGNALGGCGQINMEFAHRDPKHNDKRYSKLINANEIDFAPLWNATLWLDLLDVWREWHLNDMKAGCEHQRALGWTSYDEHPSEPCPVCGYRYGTAWLKVEVPERVIDFLLALPDASRQPAWA